MLGQKITPEMLDKIKEDIKSGMTIGAACAKQKISVRGYRNHVPVAAVNKMKPKTQQKITYTKRAYTKRAYTKRAYTKRAYTKRAGNVIALPPAPPTRLMLVIGSPEEISQVMRGGL